MFGRFGPALVYCAAHEQNGIFSQEHMLLLQRLPARQRLVLRMRVVCQHGKQERQRLNAVLQCAVDATLGSIRRETFSLFQYRCPENGFNDYEIKLGQAFLPGEGYNALIDL